MKGLVVFVLVAGCDNNSSQVAAQDQSTVASGDLALTNVAICDQVCDVSGSCESASAMAIVACKNDCPNGRFGSGMCTNQELQRECAVACIQKYSDCDNLANCLTGCDCG